MNEKHKELRARLLKQAVIHQEALIKHLESMPADRNEFPWLEKSIKLEAQILYLAEGLEMEKGKKNG